MVTANLKPSNTHFATFLHVFTRQCCKFKVSLEYDNLSVGQTALVFTRFYCSIVQIIHNTISIMPKLSSLVQNHGLCNQTAWVPNLNSTTELKFKIYLTALSFLIHNV